MKALAQDQAVMNVLVSGQKHCDDNQSLLESEPTLTCIKLTLWKLVYVLQPVGSVSCVVHMHISHFINGFEPAIEYSVFRFEGMIHV